jgi:carbon starvation protein
MFFMMATTLIAMVVNLRGYIERGEHLLTIVGSCIAGIAIWLLVEAVLALRRYRTSPVVSSPDIPVE